MFLQSALPNRSTRQWQRLWSLLTLLVLVFSSLPGGSVAFAATVNNPPTGGHSIIVFPQRDFVSASGYAEDDLVVVKVIHPNGTTWSTDPANPIVPQPEPGAQPGDPFAGIVEVNHPGGACWFGTTPDIRPGDVVQIDIVGGPRTDTSDATTTANVTAKRPIQTGPDSIEVHGTAQDALGNPLPIDQLEQRLVIPGDQFNFNGRRTLRASSVGEDGLLAYDAPGSINWTATYAGLDEEDIARALGAESRGMWLGGDPAAGVEGTIYEIGAAVAAGPAAPCMAPLEILPPPPGSELVPPSTPTNLQVSVSNSNTVTLSWDASSDNVGVTSYGIYRNGLPVANVQNPDATAPAPTTFADKNVAPGTYIYTVDAADEIGNRSAQSDGVEATTEAQIAPNDPANEPPANGRAILSFPSRDFVSLEGYLADEHISVLVIRDGVVVSTASNLIPVDGVAEVNHPGGACWEGVTPELRAGDVVRAIAYAPDNSVRSIDQVTVANVTAGTAVVVQPATGGQSNGIIQIHGTAQDAAGQPLPIDQLEQRLISSSAEPFELNDRRSLRADVSGAQDGILTYDTVNNPTGTKWTATYSGLSAADVTLAQDVESRILWLGRDPLAGIEITLFEVGLLDPPGPAPAFCTSPLEAADVSAPSAPTNLSADQIGSNDFRLRWDAAIDDWYVLGYQVIKDGQVIAYVSGNTLEYIDQDVTPGAHTYAVAAFDSASPRGAGATIIEQLWDGQGQPYGNVSAASNAVDVVQVDVVPPSIPVNLMGVVSGNVVSLTWGDSSDDVAVAGYRVYRNPMSSGSPATFDIVGPINAFLDIVPNFDTYTYRVDAVDTSGNRSAQSTVATVFVTSEPDSAAPSIPTSVLATTSPDIHGASVLVSWLASTDNVGVTGYSVYRNNVKIATLNGETFAYLDANRPAGTYTYTIDAFDSVANRSAKSGPSIAVVANDPPAATHELIAFPARDFISAAGYPAAQGPYTFAVLRGGQTFFSAPFNSDLTGFVEVNHPGGSCWQVNTPDMRPGDVIRITNNFGVADQTTIANVTAGRALAINANTVIVQGTAADLAGNPLPISQLEHRLVSSGNLFELNGSRTLRAGPALDGTIAYDAPGSIHWTATYTGLSLNDVLRAVGGLSPTNNNFPGAESRIMWLGRNPLAGAEATIFENGPGVTGGPSTPECTALAESPVAGAFLSPANLNFGNVSAVPAATSASQAITLTNNGLAPMTIHNVYLAGLNLADFSIASSTCGASLAPGASCVVNITFSPKAIGLRQANLSFSNNAANTTDQTIRISGTGIDATAPLAPAAAPAIVLSNNANILTNLIPFSISWPASASPVNNPSGTATLAYQLEVSNNGGTSFTSLAAQAGTSFNAALAAGAYRFRVRACYNTSCSAWSTGPNLTLTAIQNNNRSISYNGTWTLNALTGAYGGSVNFAATNREKASLRFNGSSVAYVATTGPNRGRVAIFINNVRVAIVDLYSPTVQPARIVYVVSGLVNAQHQITIQPLGNRNASSIGNRVDLDAFIVVR